MNAVDAIVDVWCDVPIPPLLKEIASLEASSWPFRYHFVVGMCVGSAVQDVADFTLDIRSFVSPGRLALKACLQAQREKLHGSSGSGH
jgi:hypothetical protein